ncbi:hypothetical protein L1987_29088 [Smallanthus sonchifolius]|uniref:Uncharacterized protein n=1 Tax=Smallanthus sonchifolius TaxID=185202 RepID=A0ACB9I090_9ASTR|nr:hypothetical protein L1987_29088 [Smallanthus sonchifolius]
MTDQNAFVADSTFYETITTSFELLDISVDDGTNKKMRIELGMRLNSAIREKELVEKEKLEKERLAQEALAFEENRMLKLVEESKRLKQESVKTSTDSSKNMNLTSISYNINLFRECLDQPFLQLSGLLSSSQTTSILRSSTSSLTSSLVTGHELHLKTVASNGDEPVQFVNEFVTPENELLLKIPDLALEKQEGNMNESSVVKNEPVVADIPEVGHSVASAQTYAEQVAAPLTVKRFSKKKLCEGCTKEDRICKNE